MKVWLITWQWIADSTAVADKIAAILPPKLSVKTVSNHVETLYALATSTLHELAEYASHPSRNPYRPTRDGPYIVCGHNPHLLARFVTELEITRGSDGLEEASWKEPDRFALGEAGGPKKVGEGTTATVRRRIRGPLSSMPIWDRGTHRFKTGWGPGETPPDLL